MLPTSETYNFQSVQVELLIREAFERIGITGDFLDTLKIESAKRSINLLLLEWQEKSTNLWTLQNEFLTLLPGKGQYPLPTYVQNIIQVNLRTSSRQLSTFGIAQSNTGNTYDNGGGGIAANAYDINNNTACTQTVVNGNISYDFGITNPGPNQVINYTTITFIGIESNITIDYDLVLEVAQNNPENPDSWLEVMSLYIDNIPNYFYQKGIITWFNLPAPVTGRYFRIRELEGKTLNIAGIFNNNNTFDYNMANVSRFDYNNYPNKFLQSRPSVYYLDRQITPILNIWPTPAIQYNCLSYSYKRMMQDVTLLTDTIEIPAKMYPALIWGLTYQLAIKFNPQIAEMTEAKYEKAFHEATKEDSENTIISIKGGN